MTLRPACDSARTRSSRPWARAVWVKSTGRTTRSSPRRRRQGSARPPREGPRICRALRARGAGRRGALAPQHPVDFRLRHAGRRLLRRDRAARGGDAPRTGSTAAPIPAPAGPRATRCRSPRDWPRRTRSGIVHRDLKPENVFVRRTATSRSSTSAWPSARACRTDSRRGARGLRTSPSPAPSWARSATCRPSRSAATASTTARTSSRSARSCTSCSPAGRRSRGTRPRTPWPRS